MHRKPVRLHIAWIVSLLLLASALAGCTGSSGSAGNEAAGGAAKTAAAERTVKHLLGETTVKGEPKRVVSLHPWLTDFLLSMGVTPAAAPSAGPNNPKFPWYFEKSLSGTVNLGWQIPQPNLESILAASPDLIVANQNHEKVYEQLSKIAPTIAIEPFKDDNGNRRMRDTLLQFAAMMNKDEQAKQAIAQYDAKVKQARDQVKTKVGSGTVMFLRVTEKDLRYYSTSLFEVLYSDLGLTPPPSVPDAKTGYVALSIEKLPEINPDHIFLLVENKDKISSIEQLTLWKQLKAVKNNQVYSVDYDLWFQGFGPIANTMMLEDAVKKLLK
ncbi:Fe(3+)-citrate-binding protein YfmC [Paenibacillus solanacearum]|uniref:Fe(3+)-citrate-binding protein YfmC n=1 Tax=Paenibacillus solanacearum TaxID=2048548 RepID=A0A916K1C3_9BACL|nr:iron-siderophore ABC transporter substrate-binding protein [Paenibacillus solanacearum]CAG7624080.1 Fe(3+)-citrate-binding protein YfmC [Paenibacillus solanacearum]